MDEKIPPNTPEQLADVEVGEILRRTRTHYGQSLKDVEGVLRIRAIQIDAIEKGDVSKLPGRVYAIGFVRSYAEYLGLDGAKVVQLFKAQYMDPQPREILSFPVPASETRTPPAWLAVACVGLAILIFAGWSFMQPKAQLNVSEIQTLPKEIQQRISEKVTAPQKEPEKPEVLLQEKGISNGEGVVADDGTEHKGLILKIKSNSWVEIKDGSGKVIVSNVLNKGDQYFVPNSPGLTMSLGNAGGVELTLNGQTLMPLGKDGDVLRDIPLDTAHLKTLEFKPSEAEEAPKKAKITPAKQN